MGNVVWKVMASAAALGAGIVAREATNGSWKFLRGDDAPENPEDPDTGWGEAIAFAVLSGVIVGLTRLVANRQAAKIYKKSAGHLPKQLAKKS